MNILQMLTVHNSDLQLQRKLRQLLQGVKHYRKIVNKFTSRMTMCQAGIHSVVAAVTEWDLPMHSQSADAWLENIPKLP